MCAYILKGGGIEVPEPYPVSTGVRVDVLDEEVDVCV